ncbi:tRNA synthetases class I-domain-containing protein [Mycena amicta]|nr:tRNA synthetases class I-domain-containing protein [Mycena amicta]
MATAPDKHAFAQSVLLPKTPFPLRQAKDDTRLRARTTTEVYQWQSKNTDRSEFILHDGPPYANGDLHMGHAMNKILKDIIIRFYVSRGRRVTYIPGWDCHGLPIENKALEELAADSSSLSPLLIRQAAHKTALREVENQKAQFQRLGIMADWSTETTYRTIDHSYQMRQLRIFQSMVENDLIFRRYRPVHYSPSSHSALAEAELVYKDHHVSHSVYVSFALRSTQSDELQRLLDTENLSVQLLVWTTTPWTLTANMAIAVHPSMTYAVVRRVSEADSPGPLFLVGKDLLPTLAGIIGETTVLLELPGSDLVGTSYAPIFSKLSPQLPLDFLQIIPAEHVTDSSGTGLVHCAPAHGAEDYFVLLHRGLLSQREMICHVGAAGEFTKDVVQTVGEAGKVLVGESVLDTGSRKIVELLEEVGALVKIRRVQHRYPYDWRTDQPIIMTATSQWFTNLDNIKTDALAALEKVAFYPPTSRARLTSFIDLRSEWCISRQRAWGAWRKGTDTMDVWFDSGTAWSMLPTREDRPRADLCLEGSDQHRGWFQSQLLTAVASAPTEHRQQSPYGTLITHGMVLDHKGKKMSKSRGNVRSPMTIVNGGSDLNKDPAYGADVLRYWIGSVDYWNDTFLGQFVERYIMSELYLLEKTAVEGYSQYNFAKVATALNNFVSITLSSLYFDISKDALYANALYSPERRAIVTVLEHLATMEHIMAPIVPHLAEEIHEAFTETETSIFKTEWKSLLQSNSREKDSKWHDTQASEEMGLLLRLRSAVLSGLEEAREDKKIRSSLEADVELLVPELEEPSSFIELLQREESLLKTLFITSNATLIDEGSLGTSSPAWLYVSSTPLPGMEDEDLAIRVKPAQLEKCSRCWTFTRPMSDSLF